MALGQVNVRTSRAVPTPAPSSLTKSRIVQTFREGLALSLEIWILGLLVFLRIVELGGSPSHCTADIH
jgi:hypothetical protein